MKSFTVTGTYKEKNTQKPFTRTVAAESDKRAQEKVLSLLGSEHATARRFIEIKDVQEETNPKKPRGEIHG